MARASVWVTGARARDESRISSTSTPPSVGPIAVAVAVSHNLYAMIGWGLVASIVQLLTFIAARLALPRLNESIPQGKLASGIFLASLAIGVGILNAGCIV